MTSEQKDALAEALRRLDAAQSAVLYQGPGDGRAEELVAAEAAYLELIEELG